MAPLLQAVGEVRHRTAIAPQFLGGIQIGHQQQLHAEAEGVSVGCLITKLQVVLPALLFSSDLLPGGGPLNGRRWTGQRLLEDWGAATAAEPLVLATAMPELVAKAEPLLRQAGLTGPLRCIGLLDPVPFREPGALFLPDPSIGRWSHWRNAEAPAAFSLIGQIHTLSTSSALGHLEALVSEPVHPWDAVICSSRAGREVVEAVMVAREQLLAARSGGNLQRLQSQRPQLPIVPLPVDTKVLGQGLLGRQQARQQLGLPVDAHVVVWLGRLSMLTKLDPWPGYALLQRMAQKLQGPLVFIECGPDDAPQQGQHFAQLRQLCPAVLFLRLGGDQPVEESLKQQALAAADVALSLVDNTQETFGLAVAEAMAAGLPVVASNWNGYRDLVQHGSTGFLVPTRWSPSAPLCSPSLGWQLELGLAPFQMVAGALAQVVQVDGAAAEAALLALLLDPSLARQMGRQGQLYAQRHWDRQVVMAAYQELFDELAERRSQAPAGAHQPNPLPPRLDPVTCFSSYPGAGAFESPAPGPSPNLVQEGRQPLIALLSQQLSECQRVQLRHDLQGKWQGAQL